MKKIYIKYILLYLIFYFIIIPFKPICILMADRKEVHFDGREDGEKLKRVEEGNTIIKTYYMRKKNPIFTKMKKLRKATSESNGV